MSMPRVAADPPAGDRRRARARPSSARAPARAAERRAAVPAGGPRSPRRWSGTWPTSATSRSCGSSAARRRGARGRPHRRRLRRLAPRPLGRARSPDRPRRGPGLRRARSARDSLARARADADLDERRPAAARRVRLRPRPAARAAAPETMLVTLAAARGPRYPLADEPPPAPAADAALDGRCSSRRAPFLLGNATTRGPTTTSGRSTRSSCPRSGSTRCR